VVDAVTAGANASSRVVCGELDCDAESCRLTGALLAGGGGETTAEGAVLGPGGTVAIVLGLGSKAAIVLGLGSKAAIVLGLGGMAAIVLRLWETAAITDLPSPSWPAICTTTPLALAIDPQTSAAEAAASGRDWCMMPPNPTALPGRPRSRLPLLVAPAAKRFNGGPHRGPSGAAGTATSGRLQQVACRTTLAVPNKLRDPNPSGAKMLARVLVVIGVSRLG
jgi:hypothetical protein